MRVGFQPIVDMRDGHVLGYEALTTFPDQSPTDAFADAWQQSSAAGVELEREAIHLACTEAQGFLTDSIYLSLNVSPATIEAGIDGLLAPLPTEKVVLEVTEHARINFRTLYTALRRFRYDRGRIAIDDVGVGFSGMWHIVQLLPDVLKVDRSLIAGLDRDPVRRAMSAAILSFAREIRATVVAEGVERPEERDWLLTIGVTMGQGFLFAPAIPGNRLTEDARATDALLAGLGRPVVPIPEQEQESE